jgi:hypothetical protein
MTIDYRMKGLISIKLLAALLQEELSPSQYFPVMTFRPKQLFFSLPHNYQSDCKIRKEEEKKIAYLYKRHSIVIHQIIFMSRYRKQSGVYFIAHISTEQEKEKPEQDKKYTYDKASEQNTGKDFQGTLKT